MRILDFSKFSKLYEAEGEEGNLPEKTKSLLNRIIAIYLQSYSALLGLTNEQYKNGMYDLELIRTEPNDKTGEARIRLKNVSNAVAKVYKNAGLDTAWLEAGNKAVDAFGALFDSFEDDKIVTQALTNEFKKSIAGRMKALQEESKKAKKANEGLGIEDYGILNEGFLTTKRGSLKGMAKQAVGIKSTLIATLGEEPGSQLGKFAKNAIDEIKDIQVRIQDLQAKKRKDVDEETLIKIGDEIDAVNDEFNKESKLDAADKKAHGEASKYYTEALTLKEKAEEKQANFRDETIENPSEEKPAEEGGDKQEAAKEEGGDKQEAAKEEGGDKQEAAKEEIKSSSVKIEGDLDPDKIDGNKVNEDVKKFQDLLLKGFRQNAATFEGNPLVKKFIKYGADGMFGKTTKAVVIALKKGFGFKDTSGVITQELIDKIDSAFLKAPEKVKPIDSKDATVKESFLIKDFNKFAILEKIEGFDMASFKEATGDGASNSSGRPKALKIGDKSYKFEEDMTDDLLEKMKEILGKGGADPIPESAIVFKEKGLGKDGAFAGNGFTRFYPDGKFWRVTTNKLGTFDPERIDSLDDLVIDEYKKKRKLRSTIKDRYGSKVREMVKLISGKKNEDGLKEFMDELSDLTPREAGLFARKYKRDNKVGFMEDFLEEDWADAIKNKDIISTDIDGKEIKKFIEKYEKELKKHENKDFVKRYDKQRNPEDSWENPEFYG